MIISHRYRYLFVELPHTGSTAISAELREHYAGERILHKHARYSEFARVATADERTYFTFSCIRNPLDEAVSVYARYRSDHQGAFSQPRPWVKPGDIEMFRWIRDTDADFPAFFRRAYRRPYDNWSSAEHDRFDFVIRFESLALDFAEVLRRLGIDPVRALPIVNRTADKARDFADYYTPEVIPQARRVFGPFMRKWNYAFPPTWGEAPVSRTARLQFAAYGLLRRLYWRHGRPRHRSARS
jgi:hypothetical protein